MIYTRILFMMADLFNIFNPLLNAALVYGVGLLLCSLLGLYIRFSVPASSTSFSSFGQFSGAARHNGTAPVIFGHSQPACAGPATSDAFFNGQVLFSATFSFLAIPTNFLMVSKRQIFNAIGISFALPAVCPSVASLSTGIRTPPYIPL